MNFHEARQIKHERGAKEHGNWDSIDPIAEMMDEFLDIYNYAQHPKFKEQFPEIADKIETDAEGFWHLLAGLDSRVGE